MNTTSAVEISIQAISPAAIVILHCRRRGWPTALETVGGQLRVVLFRDQVTVVSAVLTLSPVRAVTMGRWLYVRTADTIRAARWGPTRSNGAASTQTRALRSPVRKTVSSTNPATSPTRAGGPSALSPRCGDGPGGWRPSRRPTQCRLRARRGRCRPGCRG